MPMPATGVRIAPGFADPVIESQRTFRGVLDAMANPGRIVHLAAPMQAPEPLNPASAAIVLSLVDYETPLWLDPIAASPQTAAFLRFHTGATLVDRADQAAFAVIAGEVPALSAFPLGTDQYPESSATLIIQVENLGDGGRLTLSGPGIESTRSLTISGPPDTLGTERAALRRTFPRGLDLIFTAGDRLCAIPRTTDVSPSSDGS
jgi:alpha-D-ribose 1-methylphosphonate 5-triphosphate synthase subunit PhnH